MNSDPRPSDIEITEPERKKLLRWAEICAGISKFPEDDWSLLERLGGDLDEADRVHDLFN